MEFIITTRLRRTNRVLATGFKNLYNSIIGIWKTVKTYVYVVKVGVLRLSSCAVNSLENQGDTGFWRANHPE